MKVGADTCSTPIFFILNYKYCSDKEQRQPQFNSHITTKLNFKVFQLKVLRLTYFTLTHTISTLKATQ